MPAISVIHHNPLSSGEVSQPGSAFSFTLSSRLSLAFRKSCQLSWEQKPVGDPWEEDACHQVHALVGAVTWKQPQGLKQVCESGEHEKLSQTITCWEFLSCLGQGAPPIVRHCVNLPNVCCILGKSTGFQGQPMLAGNQYI